jgi:hypothetical protein
MYFAQFTTGDGQNTQGQEVIIPICTADDHNGIKCIGTGFFIAPYGIFATAAHVFTAFLDENGNLPVKADGSPAVGLMTFQFVPPNTIIRRIINKISFHKGDDVAVGAVQHLINKNTSEPFRNRILPMTTSVPQVDERIATWAYPNSVATYDGNNGSLLIVPKVYEGEIENEHPNGQGGMLPGRCYQTDLGIEGGASGGPVFNDNGQVFAINSTGIDGTDLAYVSHIQSIGGLPLANVQTPDGIVHENITIKELINKGSINVNLNQ